MLSTFIQWAIARRWLVILGAILITLWIFRVASQPCAIKGGTHLDLYLQTSDTHKTIPNAKVQPQIQWPSGEQKTVDFTYDAEGKHYAVLLPETAAGDYKVVILTDVNGEKVNGRFNFKR